MLCRSYCAVCNGIEAITITVEVDVSKGISFYLVGLPDSAVRESLQRISTALKVIGARIPGKRITINLAPADIRKEGSSYDLAIAIAILAASGQHIFPTLESYILMGELALDGTLRAVTGALPVALHAAASNFAGCIFPLDSAYEACEAEGIAVYGARTLKEVIEILIGEGEHYLLEPLGEERELEQPKGLPDFAQIRGQAYVKRALEIAATGGHNLLMSGPPGSGKSMMAKALASILPPLTRDEAIETTMIYSVAGKLMAGEGLRRVPPFRAPHYSSSAVAMVGGGQRATPGEISLAHNGVLYLDELPEFSTRLLEMLRQPIEEGVVSISRARYKVSYPCRFMLIASMNPCPCGYFGEESGLCSCQPYVVSRYQARISGPLLDRIDMQIEVKRVLSEQLMGVGGEEESAVIGGRVLEGRERQYFRFQQQRNLRNGEGLPDRRALLNGGMGVRELERHCKVDSDGTQLLRAAIDRLGLTARGYHKVLKVARTIADLDGSDDILSSHLAEAISYRGLTSRF